MADSVEEEKDLGVVVVRLAEVDLVDEADTETITIIMAHRTIHSNSFPTKDSVIMIMATTSPVPARRERANTMTTTIPHQTVDLIRICFLLHPLSSELC